MYILLLYIEKMAINECGKSKGCFRYCETRPQCPAEEAGYMLTIETENSNDKLNSNEALFKIGGYLTDTKTVSQCKYSRVIFSPPYIYIYIYNLY